MNSLPLHPSIVHIPIALAVLMPVIAAGLALAWWRQWLPRRAILVALALQAVLVGSSFAAMQTGESDEELVEEVLASEATLEAHEEAAEVFFWAAIGVLGLLGAAALLRSERLGRGFAVAAVVGTFVVAGLGYRVGHAGGTLVYQEGAARAYTGSQTTAGGASVSTRDGEADKHRDSHDKRDDHDDHDDHDD